MTRPPRISADSIAALSLLEYWPCWGRACWLSLSSAVIRSRSKNWSRPFARWEKEISTILWMRAAKTNWEAKASFIRTRDDLRLAQQKLLETERMATIGRMASSISHDLRHQLT